MYGDHRDIHEMKNSFPTRSSSDLPRCGEARLFARCRKPGARCARCDQDWTHQQADDFPAYVSIFVTGHLMAPVIIGLTNVEGLSTLGLVSIILPLTLILTVGLIQPAKRSEEHTSELQSLMRISYAVFCLKKTTKQ